MSTIDVGPLGQPDYVHRDDTTDVHGIPDTATLLADVAANTSAIAALEQTPVTWAGEWSNLTAYSTNEIVEHNDSAWIATAATTAGQEPGVDAIWALLAQGGDATAAVSAHNTDAAAHPGMVRAMVSPVGGGTAVEQSIKLWNVDAEAEAAAAAVGDLVFVRVP